MSKVIQVRNVPDRLHAGLVRRARARGKTLARYIREILEPEVRRGGPGAGRGPSPGAAPAEGGGADQEGAGAAGAS